MLMNVMMMMMNTMVMMNDADDDGTDGTSRQPLSVGVCQDQHKGCFQNSYTPALLTLIPLHWSHRLRGAIKKKTEKGGTYCCNQSLNHVA